MSRRLRYALGAYSILALLSALTLDGKSRIFLWILLAALALKSWIAERRNQPPGPYT